MNIEPQNKERRILKEGIFLIFQPMPKIAIKT